MERTNPSIWERIKDKVMEMQGYGTKAGQWSARKAQYAVKLYKQEGGGYKGEKDKNNSLSKWTAQDWTTKSGMKSSDSGERYLPRKAIENLSSAEYKKTSDLKKKATEEGKQFSKQPASIQAKVRLYRM
jgi:hypothetical protein